MSVSASGSSSSGFSSEGGSSIASDCTDPKVLNASQSGPDGENADDLEHNSKSIQEAVFATIFTLTKNRRLDASVRLAVARAIVEFLQLFRVLFNTNWPWAIQKELWVFKAIQWLLFRQLLLPQGYDSYITFFYFLASLILASIVATVWVALVLKGDDARNPWVNRLISTLQLFALLIYTVFWVAVLDYAAFFYNCNWNNVGKGLVVHHMSFTDTNCLATPHLAHMLFAGFVSVIFCCMTLIMCLGYADLNPMTRNWLASSDAAATFKILALKMVIVVVGTALDCVTRIQVVVVLLAVAAILYYHVIELPYYNIYTNLAWTGLWTCLLSLTCILVNLEWTHDAHQDEPEYAANQTMAVLYAILPSLAVGGLLAWGRWYLVRRVSKGMHASFEERKLSALASSTATDTKARAAGSSVVTLMGQLKGIYRFKDVRQVALLCRDMRKWDEDGVPDTEAAEYGEFVLKSGMARMPNNPALLVMYANFLIEVRKDGQAARTQLQLAQKASPTILDSLNIHMAQQLAKQLKRDGDGLDLMGYVEYQRNYRACVRMHKLALMAQRAFWNSLLRSDKISFRDMQGTLALMEETQLRATATYRRVLERYPGNGRVLKVYGRFLEYVKHDPWSASKFYEEALKQGTTESLLNMVRGQSMGDLSAAGSINEKVDGLIIINAQGVILMLNAAAITMFGYEKGELEGKNVSVLMPQPFSTQHNTFMQRYIDGGEPHILDKTRTMVALRKDHMMFPISLCVARLAGMGSDTLFMGVIRNAMSYTMESRSLVRFWASGSGIIMCAELNAANSFGLDAALLVGQPFANLCTDVEAVNRFIAAAVQCSAHDNIVESRLKAQILHAYLPPVDVELSIELGGSTQKGSDCRILTIQAQVLADDVATLVLDRKGRVVYASDKLSLMLGYPTSTLATMTLNALLPQPYCQMHGAWFKDLDRKPHSTSCRSGGVVHLLAANGTRVPVTLKMSTRDAAGSGQLLHIIQVTKSDELARLDQQRLLVSVNHKGTILETNSGVSETLFGFEGSELVGRPLAAIVDVFGIWRHQFADESSLLAMLAFQAMEGSSSAAAGAAVVGNHIKAPSWRIGVHQPVKDDKLIAEHAAQLADDESQPDKRGTGHGVGDLLHVLQQRKRLIPACMSVEVMEHDNHNLDDATTADTVPVLKVSLHRSDGLTALVEVDQHLGIIKADDSAGLMFGVSAKQLLKKSFTALIGWSTSTKFDDLLGTGNTVKKGAMKSTAGGAGASRMGTAKRITTQHLGDGKPLTLEMQALSYNQGGKTRMLVRLQLQDPTSSSLPALLQMKEGRSRMQAAAATMLSAVEHAEGQQAADLQRADSCNSSASSGHDGDQHESHIAAYRPQGDAYMESCDRTVDWVRGACILPESPRSQKHTHNDAPGTTAGHTYDVSQQIQGQQQHVNDDETVAQIAVRKYQKSRGRRRSSAMCQEPFVAKGEGYRDEDEAIGDLKGALRAVPVPAAGSAAESGSMGGSASVGDGEPSGGSVSSAADGAHDEDLAIDSRRAKRLKKLNRMMQSSVTQAATLRWKRHTLALLGILLAAHVACFVVLTLLIDDRYANATNVAVMARALDRFQAIALRAVSIQKCLLKQYQNFTVCNEDNLQVHFAKLDLNIQMAANYHRELYLGANGLQPFADARLMDYWTNKMLPESRYFTSYLTDNGTLAENYIVPSSRSLWEMGNVLVAAAKDVYLGAMALGNQVGQYFRFQYVLLNGPNSIFTGYSWSLDTFVDYSWKDLLDLSTTLIVLLVVEAVVVQLSCMAYEFYLLQQCNVSHMRLFSVVLSLPSATVKMMAQKQIQVDNDTTEDVEYDDLDMSADGAAAAGGGSAATTHAPGQLDTEARAGEKKKSVRVMVDEDATDEDGTDTKPSRNKKTSARAAARGKEKLMSAQEKSSKKRTGTGLARLQKAAYKFLFGWLDPKLKRNGKKIIADHQVLVKFMVPLLLWVAAVVIIFGVSYKDLQGLQGPLASLDTGAHVVYRLARCRLMSTMLAFSESAEETRTYRALLRSELTEFRKDYKILLYGGRMNLEANVSFDPIAPPSAFTDEAVAHIFFRTSDCLRHDQSSCITAPSDSFYDITHRGLDALVNRYLDEMQTFARLPDALANPDHPVYLFAMTVAGNDLYDGLQTACDIYVAGTISKFQGVKTLHIILLAISLACMLLFVLFLYRPYISLLHRDSKAVAGLLSQLPAEVDVEGIMKSIILGSSRVPAAVIGQSTVDMSGPAGFAGSMATASMIGPNGGMVVPAGAMGLQALPMPGAAGAGYGYGDMLHASYPGYHGQSPAAALTSTGGYHATASDTAEYGQAVY